MAQKKINIRPDVSILAVLKNLNYSYWHALAEFVDNAFQSYLDNRDDIWNADRKRIPLRVGIQLSAKDDGLIVIHDNAAGIHPNDFERAFKAGSPPPNQSGLSEFGMGMKTAATWCADRWSVRTSPLGMPLEYIVEYDIPKIVSKKLQELNVLSSGAKGVDHYTEIRLEKLNHVPTDAVIKRVRLHLASIYRVLLKSGALHITINNDPLTYESPPVLVAPYYKTPTAKPQLWKQNISLDFGRGVRVTGFVAIRESGSTSEGGLALIRRNRVIVGSGDNPYRPKAIFGGGNKFPNQRLYGELHLEGFRVSHTKDGIMWGSDVVDEDTFLAALKAQISSPEMPLLQQTLNYSKGRANSSKRGDASPKEPKETESDSNTGAKQPGSGSASSPAATGGTKGETKQAEEPRTLTVPAKPIQFTIPTTTEEVLVQVKFIRESANELLQIREADAKKVKGCREVSLTLNLDHVLFVRGEKPSFSELHRLTFVFSALGVAELMVRDAGAGVAAIRNHFNRYAKFMPPEIEPKDSRK